MGSGVAFINVNACLRAADIDGRRFISRSAVVNESGSRVRPGGKNRRVAENRFATCSVPGPDAAKLRGRVRSAVADFHLAFPRRRGIFHESPVRVCACLHGRKLRVGDARVRHRPAHNRRLPDGTGQLASPSRRRSARLLVLRARRDAGVPGAVHNVSGSRAIQRGIVFGSLAARRHLRKHRRVAEGESAVPLVDALGARSVRRSSVGMQPLNVNVAKRLCGDDVGSRSPSLGIAPLVARRNASVRADAVSDRGRRGTSAKIRVGVFHRRVFLRVQTSRVRMARAFPVVRRALVNRIRARAVGVGGILVVQPGVSGRKPGAAVAQSGNDIHAVGTTGEGVVGFARAVSEMRQLRHPVLEPGLGADEAAVVAVAQVHPFAFAGRRGDLFVVQMNLAALRVKLHRAASRRVVSVVFIAVARRAGAPSGNGVARG